MVTIERFDTVTGAITGRATVATLEDARAWARANRRKGNRTMIVR